MNKPIFSSVSGVQRRSVLLVGAALAAAPVLRAQTPARPGVCTQVADKQAYVDHLLATVDCTVMRPLKLVVNAGNGCAGPAGGGPTRTSSASGMP